MINVLNEQMKNLLVEEGIKICKSDSGVTGTELRKAHEFFGETIAATYINDFSKDSVVIAFMRAAMPMAYGFANKLDCPILFYDDKHDYNFFKENRNSFCDKNVIFIDAVINSGKGMLKAIEKSSLPKEKIKIVTNVLCDKAIEVFKDYDLYTVRISNNSFKGEKVAKQANGVGPDTGDRLFRTMDNIEKKYKAESNYNGDKTILLELGYGLVPLVNAIYQRTLSDSIKELRKFNPNIPMVQIVDNIQIDPTSFRINNGDIHTVDFNDKTDKRIIIREIMSVIEKELKLTA